MKPTLHATDGALCDASHVDNLVALARELDAIQNVESLRDALSGPLLALLPIARVALLRARDGTWESIVGPPDACRREGEYGWTPLVVGGRTVAVLGIGTGATAGPFRCLAEAAATLLEIGIRKILTIEDLRQHSARDPLTGCFTRDHAVSALEAQMRRAGRIRLPVSIIMMDIDDFKGVNDQYGHVAGDAVLAAVGDLLQRRLRQSDIRCRFGGDEFLLILPDTAPEGAVGVAESLRRSLEALEIPSLRGTVTITASFGVAATRGHTVDAPRFVDQADLALYDAKQAGRNCVRARPLQDRWSRHVGTRWTEVRSA